MFKHNRNNLKKGLVLLSITAVFFLALVPRWYYARAPLSAKPLYADMNGYADCARNLAAGNGLYTLWNGVPFRAYWPPGFPVLLSLFLVSGDSDLQVFYLFQAIVLSAGACVLLYWLGIRLAAGYCRQYGKSCGIAVFACPLIATIAMAFLEPHIFFSGILMTETFFVFMLLLWLLLLTGLRGKSHGYCLPAVAGAMLGAMSLVRSSAVFLVPVLAVVVLMRGRAWRQRFTEIAVAALMMLAVVTPWTIRNALVLNAFVPLSTTDGVNLYMGHNPDTPTQGGRKKEIREEVGNDEIRQREHFKKIAVQYIRENPFITVRNLFLKTEHLFSFTTQPFPGYLYRTGFELAVGSWPMFRWSLWLAILALPAVIIVALKDRFFAVLIIGTITMHVGAHLVFFGASRFRLPIEPLIMLLILHMVFLLFSRDSNKNPCASEACQGELK